MAAGDVTNQAILHMKGAKLEIFTIEVNTGAAVTYEVHLSKILQVQVSWNSDTTTDYPVIATFSGTTVSILPTNTVGTGFKAAVVVYGY